MSKEFRPWDLGIPNDHKVYVYKNLHKDKWSVRNHQVGEKRLVLGHTETLLLSTCTFHVSEKGRQRVLRDKRKNVHAGIVGLIQNNVWGWDTSYELATEITYDPYRHTNFVIKGTHEPVHTAALVLLLCDEEQTKVLGFQINQPTTESQDGS